MERAEEEVRVFLLQVIAKAIYAPATEMTLLSLKTPRDGPELNSAHSKHFGGESFKMHFSRNSS